VKEEMGSGSSERLGAAPRDTRGGSQRWSKGLMRNSCGYYRKGGIMAGVWGVVVTGVNGLYGGGGKVGFKRKNLPYS